MVGLLCCRAPKVGDGAAAVLGLGGDVSGVVAEHG